MNTCLEDVEATPLWSLAADRHHPHDPIGQRPCLFGSPPIIPGEASSSWLLRVAIQHGVPVRRLCREFGLYPVRADIDTYVTQPNPEELSGLTMSDTVIIRQAQQMARTLLADSTYRCLTKINGQPTLRYCPQCLAEDAIPHYRMRWRLTFQLVCPQHLIRLNTLCPHCGMAINKHDSTDTVHGVPVSEVLAYCPSCQQDLRGVSVEESSPVFIRGALDVQNFLWRLILAGQFNHPRHGTISARCLLHSYLIVDPSAGEFEDRYCGINWKVVFGPLGNSL